MGGDTVPEAAPLAPQRWFSREFEEKEFEPDMGGGAGTDLAPQIYTVHGEFVVRGIQVLLGFPSELSF